MNKFGISYMYKRYIVEKYSVVVSLFNNYIYFSGILVLAIIVGTSVYLTLRMRTVQALQLQKKDCRIQRIFET